MPAKRAMLFVDAQNLEQTAHHHYGESNAVDYVELVSLLTEEYDLIRPYLFDSHAPEDDKTDFYAFLRRELGFRVVSRKLKESGPMPVEKGVDVPLATELIAQGYEDSYDVAVLVTATPTTTEQSATSKTAGKSSKPRCSLAPCRADLETPSTTSTRSTSTTSACAASETLKQKTRDKLYVAI